MILTSNRGFGEWGGGFRGSRRRHRVARQIAAPCCRHSNRGCQLQAATTRRSDSRGDASKADRANWRTTTSTWPTAQEPRRPIGSVSSALCRPAGGRSTSDCLSSRRFPTRRRGAQDGQGMKPPAARAPRASLDGSEHRGTSEGKSDCSVNERGKFSRHFWG
jgi:hypothetical protein